MADSIKEISIGLKLDGKALNDGIKQAQSNLSQFAQTAKKIFVGYLSYSAIKGTIQAFQDFNMQISNAQMLIGGSASDLSAMANALKRFGGDTNTAISAIKQMQGHLNDLKFGSGALVTLAQKYGISVSAYDKADKVLLKLAKGIKGYSRETKIAIFNTLGLDESMQRAFMDGGVELDRLIKRQKALGTASEADLKISRDFNNAILDLKDIFQAITREMIRGIMPILKAFVDLLFKFVEILRKNKVFVGAVFAGMLVAMTPLLAMLTKMAIASLAAFAPFLAIGAIIVGIALIFEDLYYYFMGWDSATGALVKKFPFLRKVIEPLRPVIVGIVNTFKKLIDFIKNPSWSNFGAIFSEIEGVVKGAVEAIFGYIDSIFESLGEAFPKVKPFFELLRKGFSGVKDLVFELWEAVKKFFKALFEWNFDGMIQAFKDAINAIFSTIQSAWGWVKSLLPFGDAPQVPTNNDNRNITINSNVNQNFNTNASVAQIQSATSNAVDSVISQIQQ